MKLPYLNEEVVLKSAVVKYNQLSKNAALELQKVLATAGYYQGDLDGIPGVKTFKALAQFKKESCLTEPESIGSTTVKFLENLADKASLSEQVDDAKPVTLNKQTGKHTGNSIILPNKVRVHANELIVSGIPLTWGEVTKDLTRIPHSTEVVDNLIRVAKVFGWVRKEINQPLKINSGYRPPELKIGAKGSYHKTGAALDIRTIDLKDIYQLWHIMTKSSFTGLGRGMAKGFCHGDVGYRNGLKRVVFNY